MKKFWGVSLLVLCMPTFALGASGYATQKGCTFTFSANGKTEQLENIGRATFYSGLSDLWYANGESVPGANLNGLFTWGNLKSINGKSVNKSLADGAESVSFNCDKTSQNNGFAVTCGDIDGSVGQTSLGGRYFARCVKKTYKVPESVKKELKNPNAPSKSQASSSSIDSFIFQYKQKDKNSGDWQENVFNVAKAIFDTSASRYFDDRDQPLRGIPDAMYLQKIDNKSVNIAKVIQEMNATSVIFNGSDYKRTNRMFYARCNKDLQGGKKLGTIELFGERYTVFDKCVKPTAKVPAQPKKPAEKSTELPGCKLTFLDNTVYENISVGKTLVNNDGYSAEYTGTNNQILYSGSTDSGVQSLTDLYMINDTDIAAHVGGAQEIYFQCDAENQIQIKSCQDGYTPDGQFTTENGDVFYKKCVQNKPTEPEQSAPAPSPVFTEIDDMLYQHFRESSVWKNDEGKFNTARLVSDSVAGIVLGTTGGVVTSVVMKKNQVKHGLENVKCVIGGQDVADYKDVFVVGRH